MPPSGSHGTAVMTQGNAVGGGLFLFGGVGLLCFAVDQLTKVWALAEFASGAPTRWFVDGILGFGLRFNYGASLSIGESMTWVFTLLGIVAAIAIPVFVRGGSRLWALALGFVWGGALGNLADRLCGEPIGRGPVTDFIAYGNWFTGNVADVFLVLGALALVVLMAAGQAPAALERADG